MCDDVSYAPILLGGNVVGSGVFNIVNKVVHLFAAQLQVVLLAKIVNGIANL